jgi:hypothetical protein
MHITNGHDSELQRLNDKIARLEQQQQQQQQNLRAPEGAEIVVWAPADPGMADQIAATLTAAVRLSKGSVQYVACRFQRRSSGGDNRDSSSSWGLVLARTAWRIARVASSPEHRRHKRASLGTFGRHLRPCSTSR